MTLEQPTSPDDFSRELDLLRSQGLSRRLRTIEGGPGPEVRLEGLGPVVLFGSNNYLGLATHPRLIAAAQEAAAAYGVGTGASRLISGNLHLHEALENRLAGFKRGERALLFGSGYQANVGIIPALVGEGDLIFSDALNHGSLIDGCRLSRAHVTVYPHGDATALEACLNEAMPHRGRRLVVTEGLFSMDGDLAPIEELAELADRYGCLLLVDEAHSTGVFGPEGRGLVHALGLGARVHIQVGTLSKALGGYGGFVVGRASLIEWLINRARSFVFSTAPPAPAVAAALAALDLLERDPGPRRSLWQNVAALRQGLVELGLPIPAAPSPIIPIVVGDAGAVLACAEALLGQGVYIPAIRPPTVPPGTSRLRLSVSALHEPIHLTRALAALGTLVTDGRLKAGASGGAAPFSARVER